MTRTHKYSLHFLVGLFWGSLPLTAVALPFSYDEFKGHFDTTVSVGGTWRMDHPSPQLIGIANGGTSRSINDDDGNLGFDKNDTLSAVAKATHELDVKWRNYGLFARASYFYDVVADNASSLESRFAPNGTVTTNRDRGNYELGLGGRNRLASKFDLLDLFAYGKFDVGGHSVSTRYGRQVVSWGESTFISNGINAINPLDAARFRTPGSELKEALIPTWMLWSSVDLVKDLSAEVVWMTSFRETHLDPRGSFFSTSDVAAEDGTKLFTGFGRRKDDNLITDPNPGNADAQIWLPRGPDKQPNSELNQFGLSMKYFAQALNSTEFGLYYLRYHSRTPILSVVRGSTDAPFFGTTNAANLAAPTCAQSATAGCRASYFLEFPNHIDLFGLSFNTSAPLGIAVQGEYSFRPNQPLQLSGTELVLASLGLTNTVTGQGFLAPNVPAAAAVPSGTVIDGYRRVNMHQLQATFTKAFGPTLGAQQFTALSEVGLTYLDLPDGLNFSGPGAVLPAPGSGRQTNSQPDGAAAGGSTQKEGFATSTSYGYRLVGRLDYENAIGAVGLSPRVAFAHDVDGVGPSFNQDTKAITLGLGMNYLQRWQADVGFTRFFGGRTYTGTDLIPPPAGQSASFATSANPNLDRSFFAVSLSYAF